MAGVQVTFGANIEKLVDGVNDIKGYIESLAEAIGVAFSIDGLKSFIEGMAELGSHTQSVAAVLGASNQEVVELSGIAKLTSTTIDGLASGIERMSLNIQKSTKESFSPAGAALKVLGLNASELIGLPTDQYFDKLAAAVGKFNPSLNLTNALMAVGGRGVAAMLPTLLQGGEHWAEFKAAVDQASEGLAAAVPGMANTNDKLALLEISVQSVGARIFTVLKPAIDDAVEAFTRWIQSIKADDITTVVVAVGNGMINIAEQVATAFAALGGQIDAFEGKISDLGPHVQVTLTGAAAAAVRYAQHIKEPMSDIIATIRDEWSTPIVFGGTDPGAAAASTATIQQNIDKIHTSAVAARAALAGMFPTTGSAAGIAQDFLSIQKGVQDVIASYQKLNATPINMGGADALKAQMEQLQAAIKVADEQYKQTQEHLGAEAKLHEITYAQETAALLDALEDRHGMELAANAAEAEVGGQTVAQYQKIANDKIAIDAKYSADHQKIIDQAAEREAQEWKSAADQIAGAFNSQLRSLLAGTETWGQAMKKISGDIVLKFIEDQIKATIEFLANKAREVAVSIAAEDAKTAASVTGAALRSAADVASGSVSVLSVIASALKAIFAGAGQTAAGVSANVAPAVGPAAPAVGAAAGAAVIAIGTGLGKFDVGTDYVTRSGLAIIHEGEQITPAQGSGPYTGANSGGGGVTHNWNFNGPVIGTQAWINSIKPQLQRALNGYGVLNPSQA
jgi:hypothetical protein